MDPIETFVHRAGRVVATLPEGGRLALPGSLPPGQELARPPSLGPGEWLYATSRMVPALATLEADLPLFRDAESGIWETLVLDIAGGQPFLRVRNVAGDRESVHLFELAPDLAGLVGGWAASRRPTTRADTSWDAARDRRVALPEATASGASRTGYIDPGAVRILEIALHLGARTLHCCEGHPAGAYLAWEDDAPGRRLGTALAGVGWRVEPFARGLVGHMPDVSGPAAREAAWRATIAGLEARLGLGPTDGRGALDAVNRYRSGPGAASEP